MVTQQSCAAAYSAISRVTIGDSKLCAGTGTRDTCERCCDNLPMYWTTGSWHLIKPFFFLFH